jgi:hypothetical protein
LDDAGECVLEMRDEEMGDADLSEGIQYSFRRVADDDHSYNEFYPRGVEPWGPNITALLDA